MGLKEFKEDLDAEVATILANDFTVEVTNTTTVPYANDVNITFPNLDAKKMGVKLIDTCVLYIDLRRSTEMSLSLRPKTVSKLYSTFVRAMTRAARYFEGHVRGIIGDRVMILFDQDNCFVNAMDCAVLLNSVAKYVINKHFKRGEVTFGIGIDTGKMLATKTGIRKRGDDQQNYRNLVWIGRPANIASKLTDLANKPAETLDLIKVHVAYGLWPSNSATWQWREEWPHTFVGNLVTDHSTHTLRHSNPQYAAHFTMTHPTEMNSETPPILMTDRFWNSYRAAAPLSDIALSDWIKKVDVEVVGYNGNVFGGDVIKTAFKP